MITQTQIEGGWTELKGKVKEAWGKVSDDELREFEGNVEQLIGLIQQKTGETHLEIQRRLMELDSRFQPMLEQWAASAREYYEQAMQSSGENLDRMREELAARQAAGRRDRAAAPHRVGCRGVWCRHSSRCCCWFDRTLAVSAIRNPHDDPLLTRQLNIEELESSDANHVYPQRR